MTPHMSLVVMSRNRSGWLERCLSSLLAQQTGGRPFEVVVVDDGSTDETAAVVERFRGGPVDVRYRYQPHRGIGAARNAGIAEARGDLIAFLADDYVLPPVYVRTVMTFFHEHPEAVCVRARFTPAGQDLCSQVAHFHYEVGLRHTLDRTRSWRRQFARLPDLGTAVSTAHAMDAAGAAVFRRAVFDRIGLFDERWVRGEDTELTGRLRAAGLDVHFHPGLVVSRDYERTLASVLRKFWTTGIHAGRFATAGLPWRSRLPACGRLLLRSGVMPFWRARQARSPAEGLKFLPLLCAIEAAYHAGRLMGSASGASAPRPAMPVPCGATTAAIRVKSAEAARAFRP